MLGQNAALRSVRLILFAIAVAASPARAELTVAIASDGSERIVLANVRDGLEERIDYTKFAQLPEGGLAPLADLVKCASLGSKYLDQARSTDLALEVELARYNMVRLWTGRVCDGRSDVLPTDEEARKWLLDVAGLHRTSDNAPFLQSRDYLAEFYLFGARGVPPDYAAFIKYVDEQTSAKTPGFWRYEAYAYLHGLGVPRDPTRALMWIRRGAGEEHDARARMLIAQALEMGDGMPRDDAAAFNAYLEISSLVWPPMRFRLGLMYLEGRGTAKDPCEARKWLTDAATHYWSPVPQARRYLDLIRDQNLCPTPAPPEPAGPPPPPR
jgi:TPR repeat protein